MKSWLWFYSKLLANSESSLLSELTGTAADSTANLDDMADFKKEFPSIIDLDMYFFGLTYKIIFENKTIDFTKKEELKNEINAKITVLKTDPSHSKAPSNLGYLRARIRSSIEIYEKYAS